MSSVFGQEVEVDQDVINIHSDKYIKKIMQDVINIMLKYARVILQIKQHHKLFK